MKCTLTVVACLGLLPLLSRAQAPVLTGTVPAANTLTGPRTGPVSFSFSQAVANPSAIKVNTNLRQGQRTGTFIGAGTGQVQFQPDQPFAPGERVSVTVPATVSSPARVVEFRAAAGRGTATFSPPYTLMPSSNYASSPVTAADIDGDGDQDLLMAALGGGITLNLNNGSGQFVAQTTSVMVVHRPDQLKMADFNGDGILDLLSTKYFPQLNAEVAVNLGTGQGGFQSRTSLLISNQNIYFSVVGDFNADGLTDVLVAEQGGVATALRLLTGNRAGVPTPGPVSSATQSFNGLTAADMDGDGDLDLVLTGDGNLCLYLNDGSGRFSAGAVMPFNSALAGLTVGDFTGDGHPDVVCTNLQSANLSLVAGNGAGGLLPARNVPVFSRTGSLSSADMDGDFDLDLLVTNDRGITQVLLNNGSGQFSSASAILIGYEPYTMADAADLNGDGLLDVYTGHYNASNTSRGIDIFFNQAPTLSSTRPNGNGQLAISLSPNPAHGQAQLQLPPATGPVTVEILDLLSRVVRSVPAPATPAGGVITLPLDGLTPGLYLVQVRTAMGRSLARLQVE